VWSIDIDPACSELYKGHPQWQFIHGSSMDEKVCDFVTRGGIPNAPKNGIDLLFIDTEHTFDQAAAELALWADQVRPGGYILMHDPETFPGVRRAAQEFADARGWPITFVQAVQRHGGDCEAERMSDVLRIPLPNVRSVV
jgi:cephalosporin hydroxylase